MPHGGINRGGGELLLPPSNTRTTVAGAALAATGAVPKVYTAVAGASSSGPPSLITDIHEGLRASDFQPMDTDFAEGRRPMGLQMGKTLDDRNAAWWAERKFQEPAYLENLRQQKLDVAAFHEERRAKEYAETTAEYKEYVKKALAEVAPAEAGQVSAAAAAPAVAGQASAAAVEPATATAKATSSAAPAVARARPSVRPHLDWEGWSVVSDSDMDLEGDMDLED